MGCLALLLQLAATLALSWGAAIPQQPQQQIREYDAIIVGGGPSGLSALSGLARVRRNVLLIDSGEYRNAQTRHIHDLLGFDGVTPAYYRHAARQQLRHYSTVSWTNGTVTSITPTGNSSYTSFRVSSANNCTQSTTTTTFNISDAMIFGTTYDVINSINSSISQQIIGNVTWSGHFAGFGFYSDNLQSLWNARNDLDAWIKNLAMAMTNVIRTNGTTVDVVGSNARYAGRATSMEPRIRVRWVWLVYPAVMLLLGWVHFTVTVWQVAKGAALTWKGTPIIPLLLTVESDDGGTECIHSDGQLVKEVRDRRVVLRVEDKKGWHFSNAM